MVLICKVGTENSTEKLVIVNSLSFQISGHIMKMFWKAGTKFLFHTEVNRPSAITSKRVFDLRNFWTSETDALKCPFFLMLFDTIEFERFRGWENRGSNQKGALSLILHRRSDWSSAAFGKTTVVYGQIDENGHDVRKRTVPKMAITDKMGKNGRLSVRFQTFCTHFYGQTLRKTASVRKSSS